MFVMGSIVGLLEGVFGIFVVVVEIRSVGNKLVFFSSFMVVFVLCLLLGMVGVVVFGFDMVVVYVKYFFRNMRGE